MFLLFFKHGINRITEVMRLREYNIVILDFYNAKVEIRLVWMETKDAVLYSAFLLHAPPLHLIEFYSFLFLYKLTIFTGYNVKKYSTV